MDRSSWFYKASSSKGRLLSPANAASDLPRWRSPSPMAASIIPAPIIQSTYSNSPVTAPHSLPVNQTPLVQDRQNELEGDLQFLLDAQAEGLIRGLEGGKPDDQTSTGSTTPTAQSVRSSSARRKLQVTPKKVSLRYARKGIYTAILALSTVKEEEISEIDVRLRQKDDALLAIDAWEQKRNGLREASRTVEENEDTLRAQRLRHEADALQDEINNVELQLADMKSHQRRLLKQAAAAENAMQAKLASYSSSLRILEEDVQRFLSLKPTESIERPPSPEQTRVSMWQLPHKRRTLELAKEQFREEREAILQQRQSVEFEKAALYEGATIWSGAVKSIGAFERRLREEMVTLLPTNTLDADQEHGSAALERLQDILKELEALLAELSAVLDSAEERRWTLLIAAIGAEVDALKRGKKILAGVLESSSETSTDIAGVPTQSLIDTATTGTIQNDFDEEVSGLEKSSMTARRTTRVSRVKETSESDDDPDPDLMFSRSNIDEG